jgi:hypothetical protein
MLKLAVIAGLAALAACGSESDRSPTAAPVVAHAAAPPARSHDFTLGPGLEMRHPIRDGHLTIIPIAFTGVAPPADVLSLDDGMSRHLVTVREQGSDYSNAKVRNKSDRPLFVMSGELILGGPQDHAFAQSEIIPPHSSAVVPVYCIEQGRNAGPKAFYPGHAMVDLALRRTFRFGNQSDVWKQIGDDNKRLGLAPRTSTYRDAADLQQAAPAVARKDALRAQLGDEHLVGVAVAYDGELYAIDRFATPELFRTHMDELLGSYVAGDDGTHHEGHAIAPDDVRRALVDSGLTRTTDVSVETMTMPPPRTPAVH